MARAAPQLAKLTRPRLHKAVPRERLFALLDEAREHKPAICVVGPPGAGKTTLVASWLDARGIKGIWYQVDPGDADLATFFYYLGEAARPFTRKGQRPLPLLTPEYLHDVEGFSRRFFRELFSRLPEGATVVLDNYQEVAPEQQFHQLIPQAIDEVPEGNTLLVVSRRDPPDCYARLIANENVVFVDWENLKLTLEEAQSIASGRRQGHHALIRELHERSGGWAAGLILMLESLHSDGPQQYSSHESQHKVFGYFAAQIFDRIPDEVRRFLMATADLPWIVEGLGDLLGGTGSTRRILEDLCRRNLFTYRRSGNTPSYQFHALFQEFLKSRADELVPETVRAGLRRRSARFMEESGHLAEAFHLYREAQAWEASSELILRHAPDLVGHGRFQTLAEWVSALPDSAVRSEPWLAYWHGRALVPFDPSSGRKLLEQAHAGFRVNGDVAGEVAAAASIIDSIYIENRYFVGMDPWIDILEGRLKELESLPSPAMKLRVYSSGVIAMLYRQPGNALIGTWLARLVSSLELDIDVNTRVSAAISVLTYASASGDFAAGHRVRALIDPIVAGEEVAPAHRYLWRIWLGYFFMLLGDYDAAGEQYRAADADNADNQFPWSANLLFIKALCVIGQGDMRRAAASLDAVELVANRSRPQDLGYLHVARAWRGVVTGDAETARREAETAVAIAEQIGNFTLTVIWLAPMMWALASMRRREEFMSHLDRTFLKVRDTCYRRPHVELLALKAWLLLREGDRDSARTAVKEALALAKSLDHGAFFHRVTQFAPDLQAFTGSVCADDDYVRASIRKFKWPVPSPTVERWPWAVKVYTLGRFVILIEDKPLTFSRKTPRKPIALLKAVIALGERNVPEQKLMDALWPTGEGDAARHAFALTLHRLRRLLRYQDAIAVADGAVTLSPDLVWTDVRAFEAVLEEECSAREHSAALLDRYRGSFLADDVDESWTVSTRERLRSKFLNAVERAGVRLEEAGRNEQAIALYLRGLDADPLAEAFYQGLMRCHVRQGRHAEAISTYRRLRQTLSVVLGVAPSPSTEALVRGLRV